MLFYVITFTLVFGLLADQNIINSNTNQNVDSEPELMQIIMFYRHGYYVPTYMFTKSEYDSYMVEAPPFGRATFLGNSQSWAMGSHLKDLYPTFFKDITRDEALFVMGEYPRSQEMSEHMFCGLVGNYPDWSYTLIAENVITTIETSGSCQECSENLFVPITELKQSKSNYVNASTEYFPVIEVKTDTDFFDIDEDCNYLDNQQYLFSLGLYDLIETTLGIIVDESEYDELVESLISDPNDDKSMGLLIVVSMYNSHLMHKIEELDFPQESMEALLKSNAWGFLYQEMFEAIFKEDLVCARVFDTYLINEVIHSLYTVKDDYLKFTAYMMHDNNLYSLHQIIVGDSITYPMYAANLRIMVYETTNLSGEKYQYVNVLYDGELIVVKGCDINCPIEQFYSYLESNLVNSEAICNSVDTDEEQVQKKKKKNFLVLDFNRKKIQ